MPMTSTMAHQASIRALRLSITALGVSPARRRRKRAIRVASSRTAPMPANSRIVLRSISDLLWSQGQQGVARAFEEGGLVLPGDPLQRRAEAQGAQQRQRQ